MATNTYRLDWLTISILILTEIKEKDQVDQQATPDIKIALGSEVKRNIPPLKFYTHGIQFQYGKLFWNIKKPEQKHLVVISGDDFSAMYLDGHNPIEALRFLLTYPESNVTRLDFAIDVKDTEGEISELYEAWQSGTLGTTAQTVSYVGSFDGQRKDKGHTLYIGSRQSEKMLRIYDKGKQLERVERWLRIELELKGAWAWQVAKAMTEQDWIAVGKSMIEKYCYSTVEWYEQAIKEGDTGAVVQKPEKLETNHEKWLREVAVPAVLQAINSDIDWVESAVLGAILAKHRNIGGEQEA